jgi:hypothetical protein
MVQLTSEQAEFYLTRINACLEYCLTLPAPHPTGFDGWAKKWISGEDRSFGSVYHMVVRVCGKYYNTFNEPVLAAFEFTPPYKRELNDQEIKELNRNLTNSELVINSKKTLDI